MTGPSISVTLRVTRQVLLRFFMRHPHFTVPRLWFSTVYRVGRHDRTTIGFAAPYLSTHWLHVVVV